MSTAVIDRPKVVDRTEVTIENALLALLDNDAICMYTKGNFKTGKITYRCDQTASWAGTCRKCGVVSLLCEDHYIHLRRPDVTLMRCSRCLTTAKVFTDLYTFVHKI